MGKRPEVVEWQPNISKPPGLTLYATHPDEAEWSYWIYALSPKLAAEACLEHAMEMGEYEWPEQAGTVEVTVCEIEIVDMPALLADRVTDWLEEIEPEDDYGVYGNHEDPFISMGPQDKKLLKALLTAALAQYFAIRPQTIDTRAEPVSQSRNGLVETKWELPFGGPKDDDNEQ